MLAINRVHLCLKTQNRQNLILDARYKIASTEEFLEEVATGDFTQWEVTTGTDKLNFNPVALFAQLIEATAGEDEQYLTELPAGAHDLNRADMPYMLFVQKRHDTHFWSNYGNFHSFEIALQVIESLQRTETIGRRDKFKLYRREEGGYKLVSES